MPPRRSTRPSAEPQAAKATTRARKNSKAAPIVIEDNSESDGIEEVAPPPKAAAPKPRRGRPAKNAIKEEDEEDVEDVTEEVMSSKGKGKGKASTVVPAKRRANRQVVGEQTDEGNTAGETTPVEDAPQRTVRRTSRQPSASRAASSKPTARKASGGRRKRGQEEDEEDEDIEERPVKRAAIKEEPEPQSEPDAAPPEPEVDELKHDEDAAEMPGPQQESPEAEERPETPTSPPAQRSSPKGKGRANDNGEQLDDDLPDTVNVTPPRPQTKSSSAPRPTSQSNPLAKPTSQAQSQSKPQSHRNVIPDSDTEEERDLLAEAAATPLRPKLGARESMSMSAAQLQQLSSQGTQASCPPLNVYS
jgi:hypothetical protein